MDLMPKLRQRLRIERSESSVQASLPVLFFGDALTARIATIGLNLSKFEYLDRRGEMLAEGSQRFATTVSVGAVLRARLSDAQADEAIEVMRGSTCLTAFDASPFAASSAAAFGLRASVILQPLP